MANNAGAELAMLRRYERKTCANPECDTRFEGLVVRDYCSDECRWRASYLRRPTVRKKMGSGSQK